MARKKMVCDKCGGRMIRDIRVDFVKYRGEVTSLNQPGWYCTSCNEAEYSFADLVETDEPFKKFVSEVNGRLN